MLSRNRCSCGLLVHHAQYSCMLVGKLGMTHLEAQNGMLWAGCLAMQIPSGLVLGTIHLCCCSILHCLPPPSSLMPAPAGLRIVCHAHFKLSLAPLFATPFDPLPP